jgi:flagellar protein FliS
MHHLRAYQQQQHDAPATRIDLILALYDKMLARLDKAEAALGRGEPSAARTALAEAQLMVASLASGNLEGKDDLSLNLLKLYEFVGHRLNEPTLEHIRDARQILTTLREAFEAIRPEALRLEREGLVPRLDQERIVTASA